MSGVLEHLEALRRMFFKIFAVFAVFCIPGWIFSGKMVDALLRYAAPEGFKLHYFSLMEPFFVRLEVTMLAAMAVSFPFTIMFIWEFIRPALRNDEAKKLAVPVFFIIVLAFPLRPASINIVCPLPSSMKALSACPTSMK